MLTEIERFQGEYRFLSNFWPARIIHGGIEYPTVEHAYQAAKTDDVKLKQKIARARTPGIAKRLGKRAKLRSDWDEVKVAVMTGLVAIKFTINPALRKLLLDTGKARLVEGNDWNDTFWGVCRGVGENHLGCILMDIREGLRERYGSLT